MATRYFLGPMLSKISAGVAVNRMNGNLLCIQGAVASRDAGQEVGEHPAVDPVDAFDIFHTHPGVEAEDVLFAQEDDEPAPYLGPPGGPRGVDDD